ncbi:helix-turn-helix domain-containing protein [Streptococcus mutans]|uniref:helix-turn-helix domain-containing protein n=1 Tax=Streptococcus mutans TaxID=1309 RepID=UPI0028ED5599|nr:Rgg/GadR/MutR family transcriptional regulator [Streptococcus mutans]MDT9501937.1 Rgg/GadR/MutR family transcriptional regulator [Streptococcus mutans]
MKNLNTQKSMELGELYRELRIARGLKLKDVVRDNLSLSQLSRFENGQTMLSADRMLLAISGIHMSFAEFGHALNNYKETPYFAAGKKIMELYGKQDVEGLKGLLEEYKNYESREIYNRLNLLVIKDCIYSLESSYTIDQEEINLLTKYLYDIEEWTEYELYLFGNTLTLLSTEDLLFLGKAFVERDKLYRSIPSHDNAAKLALLNIISVLLERKQNYYVSYFMEILEKLLTHQDMYFIAILNFFKLVIKCTKGEKQADQELEDFLSALELIGNPALVETLKAKQKQLLSA